MMGSGNVLHDMRENDWVANGSVLSHPLTSGRRFKKPQIILILEDNAHSRPHGRSFDHGDY
jgi:hypothetical protein